MRALGLVGAAVQLALAVALGGLAMGASGGFPNPPEPVPRSLALRVLYALPAAVGALGALGGRAAVLGGAAAATAVGSFLAFSGVTFVFLIPALLFTVAAGARRSDRDRPHWSAWRVALFVAVAIPLAFAAVMTWGIYAVVVIGLGMFLVEFVRGAAGVPATAQVRGPVVGFAIAGLLVGAGWALFAITETRCWTAHKTPEGIVYREAPESRSVTVGPGSDQIAGGCNGGTLTLRGAAVSALLGLGAIGLAAVESRAQT